MCRTGAARAAHVTAQVGGGRNGAAVLTAATVHDEGERDMMSGTGLPEAGRDWFVAAAAAAVLKAADEI